MLRKVVTWLLVRLHLKGPSTKPGIEVLMDVTPFVYGMLLIVGAIKWLCPEGVHIPWYRRWQYWLKYYFRHLRAVVVGY